MEKQVEIALNVSDVGKAGCSYTVQSKCRLETWHENLNICFEWLSL